MPHYYSQRMLNPFHGIVNVVEIEGADVVCSDGETWALFVRGTTKVAELPDGSRHEVETPEVKYGLWSRRESRSPRQTPCFPSLTNNAVCRGLLREQLFA